MSGATSPLPGKKGGAIAALLSTIYIPVFALYAFAVLTGRPVPAWWSVGFQGFLLYTSAALLFMLVKNRNRIPRLETPPAMPDDFECPAVTLIASARNEEKGIERAVRSFMASDYPNLSVIVLDDRSTDSTPAILDRLAKEFPALRVVHNPPYQAGWGGKGNAVWHAVNRVMDPACKWILITDADVRMAPGAIRSAVAHAETRGADYFTCVPYFETGSFAEETAMALGSWDMGIATAHLRTQGIGGFMLLTRSIYLESGGHSVFLGHQPEDTYLAQVVRSTGAKMEMGWASDMLRIRQYVGYSEVARIWIAKLRMYFHDSALVVFSILMQVLTMQVFPLPFAVLLLVLHRHALTGSVIALAAISLAMYLCQVLRIHCSRPTLQLRGFVAWLHPACGLLRSWIVIQALVQILAGKRVLDRGRVFIANDAYRDSEAQ